MAKLLLRLRGVPEEEREVIRERLDAQGIDWYETEEGRWGVSMPAIWLRDKAQLEEALRLLDEHDRQHSAAAREAWQQAVERGEADTLWRRTRRQPLRMLLFVLAILFVLFLAMAPFLILGR